jgi:hypothetical protein
MVNLVKTNISLPCYPLRTLLYKEITISLFNFTSEYSIRKVERNPGEQKLNGTH